jgi:IMP dehydrogenase
MKVPILAANMESVIGDNLAQVLYAMGSVPIFHRFTSFEQKLKWIKQFPDCFISCGLRPEDIDELWKLIKLGLHGVCFDIAHGHDFRMRSAIKMACEHGVQVIAGNVCTADGYRDLVEAGATAVKVGIGPGAACTTRIVTGFGVPQMSALLDVRKAALKLQVPYIADGGIRHSGDAVKALAAGASSVMLGKAFAGTKEAAGERTSDTIRFRGQASKAFQTDYYGHMSNAAEGVDMYVQIQGTAKDLIESYCNGIRTGLTYGGSKTIGEFHRGMLRSRTPGLTNFYGYGIIGYQDKEARQ